MSHDEANHTCDGEPTLTDSQVLDFCREGYLLLRGVVPDGINRRACDYLEGKIPGQPQLHPRRHDRGRPQTHPRLPRAEHHLPRRLVH